MCFRSDNENSILVIFKISTGRARYRTRTESELNETAGPHPENQASNGILPVV